MSITVQCHECSRILELDDGFRGGVCRCSFCGALLQVPKEVGATERAIRPSAPSKAGVTARPSSPDGDPGLSGARPSSAGTRRPADPTGSGAFAGSPMREASPLSGVTASSMTSRFGDASGVIPSAYVDRSGRGKAKKSKTNLNIVYALIALGVLFVATLAIIVFVVMRSSSRAGSSKNPPENLVSHSATNQNAPAGPSFLRIPLVGKRIVLSLDSSSANTDSFSYVAEAVGNAVKTLGPAQKFRIALWTENGIQTLPAHGWLTKADAASDLNKLMNVNVYGSSDAKACMADSLKLGGDQIIFVTAKALLPDHLSAEVMQARHGGERIDTITVNGAKTQLRKLAAAGDGKFENLSSSDIQSILGGN